ncbi:hypothetical protein M885DRAFT_526054 [Pelagophyceae sp. CCMP2097]|nr:hypothetical protein M885DRAFT_526054 [Pelagophyceae sp. CCMP2097]
MTSRRWCSALLAGCWFSQALCLFPAAAPQRAPQRFAPRAPRVTAEEIDLAKSIDIVDFAEDHGVFFSSRGDAFWACCPLHGERTPSFKVDAERAYFYCFGCNENGNTIKLARALNTSLTFEGAVRSLVDRAKSGGATQSAARERRAPAPAPPPDALQDMRRAVAAARGFYSSELAQNLKAGGARHYLRSRGISPETAATFRVGWSPNQRTRLCDVLRGMGFTSDTLGAAGLGVRPADDDAPMRDRFLGRIMLPINDAKGETLGFGSRTVPDLTPWGRRPNATEAPKYLNSPVTALFSKKDALFGLDVAAPYIRDLDEAILVEGYFDVLALHDVGIRNVVGVLGVGVSAAQIERAARQCDSRRVVLALDGDAAGAAAVLRLCEGILPQLEAAAGVDARVALMPGHAKDAADFVTEARTRLEDDDVAEEFQKLVIEAATPWTDRAAREPQPPNDGRRR